MAKTIDWESRLGGDLPDDATAGGFAIGAIPSTGCGPEEIAVGIDEDTANRPPSVVASRGKVVKVGIKPGSVALGSQLEHRAISESTILVSCAVQISRGVHGQAVIGAAYSKRTGCAAVSSGS